MPITYTFDHDLRLIRTKATGALSTPETLEYFKRLTSDPGCPDEAIEIVDFSWVTHFTFDYSEMCTITKQYQPIKTTKRIPATIFVCPSELQYGIGRMLEALHGIANPEHVVRVTRSPEDQEEVIDALRSNSVFWRR